MSTGPVTRLLRLMNAQHGEAREQTFNELVELVEADLKHRARQLLRGERADSLRPTILVTEAWQRLLPNRMPFNDRQHFLAVVATAMRRYIVDSARRRNAVSRGGGQATTELDDSPAASLGADPALVLDVDRAMHVLSSKEQQLVELKFYSGFTLEEIADHTGRSVDTVKRHWRLARAKLRQELADWSSRGPKSPAAS